MPKRSPIDELNLAIEEILANPAAELPVPGARQETLVRLAAELRDLPNEGFKARLRADLQKRNAVNTSKVNPVRKGFRTVTPYLQVMPVEEVIAFLKQAFGAQELFRSRGGAGGIHTEIKVGDSMLMVGGGGTYEGPARTANMLINVSNADEYYRRAIAAGAISIYEPVTHPWGDHDAGVRDAGGNNWYINTRRVTEYAPGDQGDVLLGFNPKGAARFIDFVTAAFGAETIFRHDKPKGTVAHARVRIGDSVVMVSEGRKEFPPKPPGVYLYVDDADAVYERALRAGAASLYAPTDMPYGDRMGGVTDPFGNEWYIATHFKDMVK
jgi:PhnB protein